MLKAKTTNEFSLAEGAECYNIKLSKNSNYNDGKWEFKQDENANKSKKIEVFFRGDFSMQGMG